MQIVSQMCVQLLAYFVKTINQVHSIYNLRVFTKTRIKQAIVYVVVSTLHQRSYFLINTFVGKILVF